MTAPTSTGLNLEENQGHQIQRSVIAVTILATLSLTGRLVCRKSKKADWIASDYMIIIGLVGAWAISGVTIARRALLHCSIGCLVDFVNANREPHQRLLLD